MAELTKEMYSSLDELIKRSNLDSVSSESSGRIELPDGCYLCEIKKGELKSSSTNKIMASFQFQSVDNGVDFTEDGQKAEIPRTKGKYIFRNYILEEVSEYQRFVSDMLKFRGEDGESYLPKEAFTTSETLEASLEALGDAGLYIWIQIQSYTKKDGTIGTQTSLLSWKRVEEWGLA